MKWWKQAGGWDISYPDYSWYENDIRMFQQIRKQNLATSRFLWETKDNITNALSNLHLCSILGLSIENLTVKSFDKDMQVYVYTPSKS